MGTRPSPATTCDGEGKLPGACRSGWNEAFFWSGFVFHEGWKPPQVPPVAQPLSSQPPVPVPVLSLSSLPPLTTPRGGSPSQAPSPAQALLLPGTVHGVLLRLLLNLSTASSAVCPQRPFLSYGAVFGQRARIS